MWHIKPRREQSESTNAQPLAEVSADHQERLLMMAAFAHDQIGVVSGLVNTTEPGIDHEHVHLMQLFLYHARQYLRITYNIDEHTMQFAELGSQQASFVVGEHFPPSVLEQYKNRTGIDAFWRSCCDYVLSVYFMHDDQETILSILRGAVHQRYRECCRALQVR